jgi:hypothetical protein
MAKGCVQQAATGQRLCAACLRQLAMCVQELPDALCGLQLVLLDMTNNCLRKLPAALGHMTTLRSIPLVSWTTVLAGRHTLLACCEAYHAATDGTYAAGKNGSVGQPPLLVIFFAGWQPTQVDAERALGRWVCCCSAGCAFWGVLGGLWIVSESAQ